jgi:hypothetical protein
MHVGAARDNVAVQFEPNDLKQNGIKNMYVPVTRRGGNGGNGGGCSCGGNDVDKDSGGSGVVSTLDGIGNWGIVRYDCIHRHCDDSEDPCRRTVAWLLGHATASLATLSYSTPGVAAPTTGT